MEVSPFISDSERYTSEAQIGHSALFATQKGRLEVAKRDTISHFAN